MSDKPMTLSQRAARKVITEIYANPAPESDVSEIAAIIARETGCDANADIVRRLVDALNQFKHADGCFCEAAFAPSGCHVRHSDECEAAMKALSDAAALRRAGGND